MNAAGILDINTYTAQKEHVCEHCGDPIESGQKYVRLSTLEEGEFSMVKFHHFSEPCNHPKDQRWRNYHDR